MEIIYYLINFAILAGIIFLFGRNFIISLFRTRRVGIEDALDRAEHPELFEETKEAGESENSETASAAEENRVPEKEQLTAAEAAAASVADRVQKIEKFGEQECREIRRGMLGKVRSDAMDVFCDKVSARFTHSAYAEQLRKKEPVIVETILEKIKLTPGDMAYLKRHDVLYVTLTSAYHLEDWLVKKIEAAATALVEPIHGKISYWVQVDPTLLGGLRLRIGDTVYDGTLSNILYNYRTAVKKNPVTGEETAETYEELFRKISGKVAPELDIYQRGRAITVSDGICWMDGLADIMYGEVVEFECGERGMVLDIQHDRIGCVVFGQYERIESGSPVRRAGRIASVPVGEGLLGRVIDAIGNPIDGKGYIPHTERRPVEFHAPGILDRAPVKEPLHTGIKAIDALVPIGKGQRELLIGDRQTGKTSIALDTILNQRGKNVICIYVAIGQKETSVSDFREKLERYGALDYTIIVAETASSSAAMQYIAPFAGTAIGEYFMYSGRDVLIVYDDLSKHAVAYRELSLLLQRPSGREAYPGDIFYLHSRLLERSAHLSEDLGGGSMTALPIVETQAGDISSYIPTNTISITDGQIFLESELFHEGQRPAVNVGLSVSRVGGAAQTKLMKQVAASLRTRLAQYRELAEFTQFGTDVDKETRRALTSGEHLTEAMKQPCYAPLEDWKQALLLYAVSEGFTDEFPTSRVAEFENLLLSVFPEEYPELTDTLKTGAKITPETAEKLRTAIAAVVTRF